jgi:hypothetical protein
MKINVKKVLKREADEKARVKPLPKIRVKGPSGYQVNKPQLKIIVVNDDRINNLIKQQVELNKDLLLKDLWVEMGQLKRDRGKLSTSIAWKVVEIDTKLTKESPGMADEFMKGNLPMPELEDLATQIQSFTDRMMSVWDKIRHVEQYGVLPGVESVSLEIEQKPVDVSALHHEIRRLDDLIYKCNKKLLNNNTGIKAPKNTGKVAEWKEKIALADAKRIDLKLQLKKLQYEAREQRAGEE